MSESQKCAWAPCKKGRLCLVCMKDIQISSGADEITMVLDEGVQRVIFSNISYYTNYVLMSD